MNAWWSGEPTERFWLEITDRPDIGADLHCPQRDAIGNRSPGYSLIWWVRPGDIVFHYDRKARAISWLVSCCRLRAWKRRPCGYPIVEIPVVGSGKRRRSPGWWLDLEGAVSPDEAAHAPSAATAW